MSFILSTKTSFSQLIFQIPDTIYSKTNKIVKIDLELKNQSKDYNINFVYSNNVFHEIDYQYVFNKSCFTEPKLKFDSILINFLLKDYCLCDSLSFGFCAYYSNYKNLYSQMIFEDNFTTGNKRRLKKIRFSRFNKTQRISLLFYGSMVRDTIDVTLYYKNYKYKKIKASKNVFFGEIISNFTIVYNE